MHFIKYIYIYKFSGRKWDPLDRSTPIADNQYFFNINSNSPPLTPADSQYPHTTRPPSITQLTQVTTVVSLNYWKFYFTTITPSEAYVWKTNTRLPSVFTNLLYCEVKSVQKEKLRQHVPEARLDSLTLGSVTETVCVSHALTHTAVVCDSSPTHTHTPTRLLRAMTSTDGRTARHK